jgi:hypothetical protein
MKLPSWLYSRQAHSVAEGEIKELTDQFYVTLRANFSRIHAFDRMPAQDALQRLKNQLNPGQPRSWSDAYEIEQMLVYLFDDETLKTELGVRTLEARRTLNPLLAGHYASEKQEANCAERQRGLLARLVNDLQWRYTVNEVKRRYSQEITSRTGWLFALALLFFGAWTAYVVLSESAIRDLNLLIFAALAGTWGAAFSMLASLKSRLQASELDDMKLMRPWVMLLSRVLIGTGAGSALYFFLRSLLAGSAFPQLTTLDPAAVVSFKDLALLIIWCFIAGFSEKLVPSILEKTEARAATTGRAESDRFRPGSNGDGLRPGPTKPPEGEAAKGAETAAKSSSSRRDWSAEGTAMFCILPTKRGQFRLPVANSADS